MIVRVVIKNDRIIGFSDINGNRITPFIEEIGYPGVRIGIGDITIIDGVRYSFMAITSNGEVSLSKI